MPRLHHRLKRLLERLRWIGEEGGYAAQRLIVPCIQHMKDRPNKQRVTRLLPVIALLERAFRIDENIGDVLNIAHFMQSAPNFKQRVVCGRANISRIEEQAIRES